MENYIEIHLEAISEAVLSELSNLAMNEFGCQGVQDYEMDEAEVDSLLGQRAYSGGDIPETVYNEVDDSNKNNKAILFFSGENKELFVNNFEKYLSNRKDVSFSKYQKENKDWNEEWRKSFSEIEISDDLTIVPSWESGDKETSLFIYPGMGFGTGTHETTYLCLKDFIEIKPFDSILDFGCGSGILGLAALKFGASLIDMVDIDKDALKNCQQNFDLNFSETDSKKINLFLRKEYKQKSYELIFANILLPVLIEERETFVNSLVPGGKIITSGVLKEQVATLIEEYSPLFKHISTKTKNDWASVLFEKL